MSIEPDKDGTPRRVDDLDAARGLINGLVFYYVW